MTTDTILQAYYDMKRDLFKTEVLLDRLRELAEDIEESSSTGKNPSVLVECVQEKLRSAQASAEALFKVIVSEAGGAR